MDPCDCQRHDTLQAFIGPFEIRKWIPLDSKTRPQMQMPQATPWPELPDSGLNQILSQEKENCSGS